MSRGPARAEWTVVGLAALAFAAVVFRDSNPFASSVADFPAVPDDAEYVLHAENIAGRAELAALRLVGWDSGKTLVSGMAYLPSMGCGGVERRDDTPRHPFMPLPDFQVWLDLLCLNPIIAARELLSGRNCFRQ
jgi:hypothetical protein